MTVGYDLLPVNFKQVLSVPMREATGLVTLPTQDVARPHHTVVLGSGGPPVINAPTWAQHAVSHLTHMTFAAAQALSIGAAAVVTPADMNFRTGGVAGGFSFAGWYYFTNLAAINTLLCYGEGIVGAGYQINVLPTGEIQFITYQGGPVSQITDTLAGCITTNRWWFIEVTCDGAWDTAAAKIYRNAIDVTDTADVHISPASPLARDFYIGAHDDGAVAPGDAELSLIGNMWNPRCWTRQRPQIQGWETFEMERHLFDV